MELSQPVVLPARTIYVAVEHDLALTAGKGLNIRRKSPTVNMLDVDVPAGKKWVVDTIYVEITETDA